PRPSTSPPSPYPTLFRSFDDGRRFIDPETGEALPGDARALRAGFLARFGEAQQRLHARLAEAGIRRAVHVLDEPLLRPLKQLFRSEEHTAELQSRENLVC